MTRQTQTDNVLVSREKLEKLKDITTAFRDEMLSFHAITSDNLCQSGVNEINAILAMPDFIESERDVEKVGFALVDKRDSLMQDQLYPRTEQEITDILARAAINALRRKEGG